MALTDMVIMPGADYQAVCDAIREKTGSAGYLRSGELAAAIRGISGGGGGSEVLDALIDRTITEVTTGVEIIGMFAFYYCSSLTKADLKNAKEIRNYAFYATMLDTLILRRTDAVCAVKGDMAIEGSNLSVYNGYIYVPAALVSSYQADEFWSGYDWMIRALEDYTVDGTVTGALDETKIGEE